MKFLRAGGKSKFKVEPGSTLMITTRPVSDSYFTMFFGRFFLFQLLGLWHPV